MLASTSVFATRARIEALGESSNGSFYIEDTRNVFLNAAHVNHAADSIILEWGNQKDYDSQRSSDAEGGFFKKRGNLTYGAYFGRQNTAHQAVRNLHTNAAVGGTTLLNVENTVDLFLGGKCSKTDIEWGASISYSSC